MSVTTESILSNQNETTKDTPKENEEKFDNKMEVDTQINSQNQLNDKDKPMRVLINKESFSDLTKDDLVKKWKEQDVYIDSLEEKLKVELSNKEWYQDNEDKYKQQLFDLTRKENLLLMKLTTKEHEMQDYIKQIQELKLSQIASNDQLQSTFLDPAVNMIFEEMKKEVEKCKLKVEEMQNELSAWKFTPDSNTGKRLMAKCRLLYQENEELGKVISSGRIAKLEGELALQKSFSEEMKKSQGELDDFLFELEEDVEGMQSTIYHLQQQLKESKELLQKYKLKEEDDQSKDNSKTDSTEKASEELTNNKQNNESNNEENKDNDSVNDDNLNVKSNNELNGDKSNDNQTVEEKNNPERKRSLDEVLEEVNQSGTECGIDSILKKHRKIDQENENILKNS